MEWIHSTLGGKVYWCPMQTTQAEPCLRGVHVRRVARHQRSAKRQTYHSEWEPLKDN